MPAPPAARPTTAHDRPDRPPARPALADGGDLGKTSALPAPAVGAGDPGGGGRASKLDAFKPAIERLLAAHAYSAAQLFTWLAEQGYTGKYSILKTYVRTVRPPRAEAFLTLHFAPGQCAQVDWGSWGSIRVGNTRRRLSFFVLVLCHSRQLYLEFTLGQSQEQWLACHEHAFAYLGGVPAELMVDNCKTAILAHAAGTPPVFNPTAAHGEQGQTGGITPEPYPSDIPNLGSQAPPGDSHGRGRSSFN